MGSNVSPLLWRCSWRIFLEFVFRWWKSPSASSVEKPSAASPAAAAAPAAAAPVGTSSAFSSVFRLGWRQRLEGRSFSARNGSEPA